MPSTLKEKARKFLAKVPEENVFRCQDGCTLHSIEELGEALNTMTDDTFSHHVNVQKNDFANWVSNVIGDKKLAEDLTRSRNRVQAAKTVIGRVATLTRRARGLRWPSEKRRHKISEYLTIYGSWIGVFLGIMAIVVAFGIFSTAKTLLAELESVGPRISNILVQTVWDKDYKPNEQIEEVFRNLLMGQAYQQPVWDFEDVWYHFPESDNDFPSHPAIVPTADILMLRRYRIAGVPPLRADQTPQEARLRLSGVDNWEWNIDDRVLSYISDSEAQRRNEVAWYKVAIAMVGGYSEKQGPGLSAETRKAAIDAFKSAEWSFELHYEVWNGEEKPIKSAEVIFDDKRLEIRSPESINHKDFTVEPGREEAINFTFVPRYRYETLASAKSEAENLKENIKTRVHPELVLVPRWPLPLIVVVPVLVGMACATIMMWFFGRQTD